MKKISKEQLVELKDWLDNFELPRRNRKISRDFSDGAMLLKQFYPKIIELHNYPSRNATSLKQNNWETLNRKVLAKIGVPQSKEFIKKLSESVPGAAELLLYEIMQFIKEEKAKKKSADGDNAEDDGDIITVKVSKRVGDGLIQVPQKMILYSLYEESQEKIGCLRDVIRGLNQKIVHLENCLKLKAEKIEELNNKFQRLPSKSNCTDDSMSKCSRRSSP